ncbi:MAG TPA: ABC transporter permease subunit, partial [Candidatus Saccharimonadales bacterium]|nr:ABC transporter permease subunit [Candidatus Saccharimonadales bacterium]
MTAPAVPGPSLRSTRVRLRVRGWREFMGRFAKRREGLLGLALILVFTVLAIAPQLFVGPLETVTTATGGRLEPPSPEHILGTDELGRDILNLTVHGARVSMVIGLLATLVTVSIGVLIGVVSGFIGGWLDSGLMRITDFFLVLPTFVLALVLAPILREIIGAQSEFFGIRVTLYVIVIVIGITSWAATA